MHLFSLCFSGFRGGGTAFPPSQPLECLSQPYRTDNPYPWHGGTMPPLHSRSSVFPTSAPSLETADVATLLEEWFPRTFCPIPLLLLCPSSMPGLSLPPDPSFPSPGSAFASGTLVSREGPWLFQLLSAQLGQLLSQPEVEEEQRVGSYALSLLPAEPVCTPLECGARLCLSSLSPSSYPIFLRLTLPDLISQSGMTMVGFPSSPSQGHGGGHAAGAALTMALWLVAVLKTPVGCLFLVLDVKMGRYGI